MRIEAVSLYKSPSALEVGCIKCKMPLIYPWKTAYGSDDAIESVLVQLRSGDFSCGRK